MYYALQQVAARSGLQQCIYPNWQSSVSVSDGKTKLPPATKKSSQLLPLHLSAGYRCTCLLTVPI